jgi:protein-L-isoaspartate(D-aspartate) O-methyltransferase
VHRQERPWDEGWPEIHDARVRDAFRRVSRGEFVDPGMFPWAECDEPLPIGQGQTISQPFVVALMTQALHLQPGDKVLEIGTGSGYQTAILCELAATPDTLAGSKVWSVERLAALSERAAVTLARLGYAPHLRVGDGAAGWPEAAPFNAIIVTAAASAVPEPLWAQLAEAGRMVIPVGAAPSTQTLWRLEKRDRRMLRRSLGPVRFVPLVSPILERGEGRIEIPGRNVFFRHR